MWTPESLKESSNIIHSAWNVNIFGILWYFKFPNTISTVIMEGVPQAEYDICQDLMIAYVRCVEENVVFKYFGACTTPHKNMTKCLKHLYELESNMRREKSKNWGRQHANEDKIFFNSHWNCPQSLAK